MKLTELFDGFIEAQGQLTIQTFDGVSLANILNPIVLFDDDANEIDYEADYMDMYIRYIYPKDGGIYIEVSSEE